MEDLLKKSSHQQKMFFLNHQNEQRYWRIISNGLWHFYHALKNRAKLKANETLVVLGASGGVGLAAVELGKLMGARVIALCFYR